MNDAPRIRVTQLSMRTGSNRNTSGATNSTSVRTTTVASGSCSPPVVGACTRSMSTRASWR